MPTLKTALVLAGGGSLGAVQVGMLQALVEADVVFDLVVGASVGAINGAYFAARPNAKGVSELAEFWRSLRKSDVFPFSAFDTLKGILNRRGHLLSASALHRLVSRSLPVKLIEDTVLPLYIVTTNLLRSLEEKHLHSRNALEHYRNAVKEQRDQEQQRHEGQVQQVQVELRQLQQTLMVKQDELTRLNRDNERLLSEARQQAKAAATHEDAAIRLTGEIAAMKTAVTKADGAKETLQEQLGMSRAESKRLEESLAQASVQLVEAKRVSGQYSAELTQLRLTTTHPDTDNESPTK